MLDDTRSWIDEFNELHGDSIHHKGIYYYEDGARRENSAMGVSWEPPADDWERAKFVRLYHQLHLEDAERRFRREKGLIEEAAHWAANSSINDSIALPTLTPDEARKRLKQLRAEVKRCRKELKAAEQAVDDAEPEVFKINRENAASAKRQHSEIVAAIADINI